MSTITEDGHPDYMVTFDQSWRHLVCDDAGNLDLDKVARELHDYYVVLQQVSLVYDDITDGRFSKPNTASEYIIEEVNGVQGRTYADLLCEAVADEDDEDLTRDMVITIAEGWSAGAWDRFSEARGQRNAAMKAEV